MEFCCKFYGNIEFQVVLFGLLLSFLVLNGVECDCNFYENLKPKQTYYVYNPNFPNNYEGENHCTWQLASAYNIQINCSIDMGNDCSQEGLYIRFADGNIRSYCGYDQFILNGVNVTIIFYSSFNSKGQFLCEITTFNNCECGWKKATRIVGGEETGINEYPMMCGLVDANKRMIYCGCTIISETYILTAAHCVENKNFTVTGVVVGEHDVTTGHDTSATKLFSLVGCIIYPGYENKKIAYNDVAVCKIVGVIRFSAEVGPVCLPFKHKQDSFVDSTVTALGWGLLEFAGSKSTTLQQVNLNVISLEKCQQNYPDVSDRNLCTYTPGKDTCQMDSGGPLLWQDPMTHKLVLVGITSSGVGCASNEPSVAMCMGPYLDWLIYITSDAQYCQVE